MKKDYQTLYKTLFLPSFDEIGHKIEMYLI
jgi:hypothetical protein